MTDTDTTPPGATRDRAGGPDPRVLAMARAFDRTRRKVDGLDNHVTQLAADLARLVGVVTAQRQPAAAVRPDDEPADNEPDDCGKGGPAAVRSWMLAADPGQAMADLADLIEWLDRVYLRYPNAELSACWLWHPHVIEELWWLRRAHSDAYHPKDGSWLRVGDWHDRQRPAVVKRIRDTVAKCDLSLHSPTKPHGQPAAAAPLAAHAAAIAAAWAGHGVRPEPTAQQIAEGNALFPGALPEPAVTRPACTLSGCGRPHHAHGYCRPHYVRWQRHGDPHADVPVVQRTPRGAGYWASHRRVRAARGPAAEHRCAECGAAAVVWSYDGTDPDERRDPSRGCRYSLDPARYRPRCRSCHQRATTEGRAARVWVGLDIERVARLHRAGATVRGIASLLHVSPAAVRAALRADRRPTSPGRRPEPAPPISNDLEREANRRDSEHATTRTDITKQDQQITEKGNKQRSTTRRKDNGTNNHQRRCGPMHHDPTVGSASPDGPAEPGE